MQWLPIHGLRTSVVTFASTILFLALPAHAADFFNGFEINTAGWDVFGGAFDAVRVPNNTDAIPGPDSGTDGTPSADAGWHATGDIPATNWGGYSSTFPTGGYRTAIDIFLDINAGYLNDTRVDFSSAVNMPDGNFRRDFVFNLGFYNDNVGLGAGTNRFIVSAGNTAGRANSFPENPAHNPIAITATGWYTFTHQFRDNGSGVLEVLMSITSARGSVVGSWTLSDPTDVIGTTVGGNRYGWFVTNELDVVPLAFDNSLKHEGSDSDADGVPDFADTTPQSDFRSFVDVGSGPTTVGNARAGVDTYGNTIQDQVNWIAKTARNHGQYVLGINLLAYSLSQNGDISQKQAQQLTLSAAQSNVGYVARR